MCFLVLKKFIYCYLEFIYCFVCVRVHQSTCVCGSRNGIGVQKQMFSQGVCGTLSSVWNGIHAVLTVIGACVKAKPS